MTMKTETCIIVYYFVLSYNFALNCPENTSFQMQQGWTKLEKEWAVHTWIRGE